MGQGGAREVEGRGASARAGRREYYALAERWAPRGGTTTTAAAVIARRSLGSRMHID